MSLPARYAFGLHACAHHGVISPQVSSNGMSLPARCAFGGASRRARGFIVQLLGPPPRLKSWRVTRVGICSRANCLGMGAFGICSRANCLGMGAASAPASAPASEPAAAAAVAAAEAAAEEEEEEEEATATA